MLKVLITLLEALKGHAPSFWQLCVPVCVTLTLQCVAVWESVAAVELWQIKLHGHWQTLTAAVGTGCSVAVKWDRAAMGPVVSWTFSSASALVWTGLSAPSCPNASHLDPRQWQDWLSGGGLPIWEDLSSGVSQIRVHEGARALVRPLEMQSFEPGYRFSVHIPCRHWDFTILWRRWKKGTLQGDCTSCISEWHPFHLHQCDL